MIILNASNVLLCYLNQWVEIYVFKLLIVAIIIKCILNF